MNNFPKGNDLIVKWAIKYSDGTPFPLKNYAWELCYSAGRGINVVNDTAVISVSDNLLTWRFSGKDQAFYGKYSLTLRLYKEGKIVATVSKTNAFELSTTRYDGPCDIDLVSYCDNISLQDALSLLNKVNEQGEKLTELSSKIGKLETGKQDKLKSGSTIKTINGQSVLGEGNIEIQGESSRKATATAMGYIILDESKTFAEQVTDASTIYEIRYDCALPTNKFTMPSNTILRFNGGKLMNGTIVGDRTSVEAIGNAHIFQNVVFEGVWDIVGGVYPEWFGAKSGKDVTGLNNYWRVSVPPSSESLPDASSAINSAIALAAISESVCRLYGGVYRIEHTIEVLPMCTLEVSSRTIIVPYMNGEGTDDNGNKVLALSPDSFIRQSKMCVALKCGTEYTKVIGGGKIVLGASTYTIGLLVDCPGYSNVDVSYYPEIDIKVFGGEASGIIPSYETIIGNANPDASIGEDGDTYYNATSKQLFEKKNGSWSDKASVVCRYNTAYRIEGRGRETGTDNRIIATDYKFNGGFAFRGIEIIMTGSAWGNSSTIKGTLQGVSSGYVTILGQTNDIDMSKMIIQGGGPMMRCNYYYYADRVKASQFGLVWDSTNDSTGYDRWFLGEATQFNLVYSGNPHRTDLGDRNYFIPWGYIARHFAEQESGSGKGGEVKDLPLQPTLGECFYWTTEAKPIWFNGEFWADILGGDVFAINFEDSRVYDILLASKDKNGDGKIDKRDLALLNNADFYSKLFGRNAQIEYFNEFKHCTGVDTLNGTSSRAYAFAECSNLKEISLPTSLQTIGECSFINCSSLTKISGGENVTYIGAQAFRNCTNLVDIGRIGENVREIGILAFGNTKLTNMVVNFPKLEGAAPGFGYTEIKEIRSLGNATSFAITEHCPNLVSVRLPATLTEMAAYGLQFNPVLEKVIFEGETPPTFAQQFLWRSDQAIIYVPDSAVDAYKGVISQYSSRIKPMSELV